MGYAGYVPAKLPPGKLTGAQAALKQVMSTEALEILYKLVYNVVISPGEAKFRRIRLSNAKINAAVVQTPGALEALLEMGWERVTEDGEDVLLLPGAAKLSMTEARWIQDRKEQVDKEMRDAFRLGKSRSASTCTLASQATTEPAG